MYVHILCCRKKKKTEYALQTISSSVDKKGLSQDVEVKGNINEAFDATDEAGIKAWYETEADVDVDQTKEEVILPLRINFLTVGFGRGGDVHYSEGSLFRNTQVSYIKRFVSPKMKKGSLIRTFEALFRRSVIPKVR